MRDSIGTIGILRCARINCMRIFSSSKTWLAIAVTLVFCFYTFSPVRQIAKFYQMNVTPWLSPFYLSFYLMLLVHGGVSLLIFSDIGECDGYSYLMIARVGRCAYINGQLISIFLVSFLYALLPWLSSLIFIFPYLEWNSDWGTLLYTLAESSDQITQQTGVQLSVVVEGEILRLFPPIVATFLSFLCLWISAAFLGTMLCFCSVVFSKKFGIVAGGFLVCLSLFSRLLGAITIGKWLQFFSPMTWSNFFYLDWFYSGQTPSPVFALIVWGASILIMSFFTVKKFTAHDIKGMERF